MDNITTFRNRYLKKNFQQTIRTPRNSPKEP